MLNYNNYLVALKQSLENDDPEYKVFAQFVYEKLNYTCKLEKSQAQELYEKCCQELESESKVKIKNNKLDLYEKVYLINKKLSKLITENEKNEKEYFQKIELPIFIQRLETCSVNDLDSSDYEEIIATLKKCQTLL